MARPSVGPRSSPAAFESEEILHRSGRSPRSPRPPPAPSLPRHPLIPLYQNARDTIGSRAPCPGYPSSLRRSFLALVGASCLPTVSGQPTALAGQEIPSPSSPHDIPLGRLLPYDFAPVEEPGRGPGAHPRKRPVRRVNPLGWPETVGRHDAPTRARRSDEARKGYRGTARADPMCPGRSGKGRDQWVTWK